MIDDANASRTGFERSNTNDRQRQHGRGRHRLTASDQHRQYASDQQRLHDATDGDRLIQVIR